MKLSRFQKQGQHMCQTQPNPQQQTMPKLPECDRCQLYARNPHLICAVHPAGPTADTCLEASMAESIERRADAAFEVKRTQIEYNLRFTQTYQSVLLENRQEVIERLFPGDDLYFPKGIN
jgi:hypothetical protein